VVCGHDLLHYFETGDCGPILRLVNYMTNFSSIRRLGFRVVMDLSPCTLGFFGFDFSKAPSVLWAQWFVLCRGRWPGVEESFVRPCGQGGKQASKISVSINEENFCSRCIEAFSSERFDLY
jgi:hypothetical protein